MLGTAAVRLLSVGFDAIDYLVLRDAETLGRYQPGRAGRVLAAVRLGAVRLIYNWEVK